MDDFHIEPGPRRGPAAGAGWYESSWDLMRGLEVREGPPADAAPGEWCQFAAPLGKMPGPGAQAAGPSAAFTALPSSITAMA